MRVWFLSNGLGEERAAALVAAALARMRPGLPVIGAPLVTNGREFSSRGLRVATTGVLPPSGGFPATSVQTLIRDLPTVPRYAGYVRRLRRLRCQGDACIVAGDVFLLGLGRLGLGRAAVHLALAKSVHGRPHSRVEHVLLRRWAELVLARDEATAQRLQDRGVRATFLGNPLVDGFPLPRSGAGPCPLVLLLPGSRSEAPVNLIRLLDVAAAVDEPATWIVAWPDSQPIDHALREAVRVGWHAENGRLQRSGRTVMISAGTFDALVSESDVVVGLAGTANEQAAGLGKPVVTSVGSGPQTTAARMEEQARLLGGAARFVDGPVGAVAAEVSLLLASPEERRRRGALGLARLGPCGAARRIAERVLQELSL